MYETVDVNLGSTRELNDKTEILDYLKSGSAVSVAMGKAPDELDESKPSVVSIGLITDGVFIWPMALNYYFGNYDIEISEKLLQHIRKNEYVAPEVSDDILNDVRNFVRENSKDYTNQGSKPQEESVDPFGATKQ